MVPSPRSPSPSDSINGSLPCVDVERRRTVTRTHGDGPHGDGEMGARGKRGRGSSSDDSRWRIQLTIQCAVPPFFSRYSMMRCASFGPTPGRLSSSDDEAVLMLMEG